jgi:uncharacterized RDD family membrane protein YckC
MILDGLIIGVPLAILQGATDGGASWDFIRLIVGVAYYGLLEGGPTGQTLGKRVCGIRVVDVDSGQPGIGYPRGVGRYFARILAAIPLFLGYFWMLWDKKSQCWQDKLARTLVVKA